MIDSAALQGMLVRGDQVYFALFLFACLLCWLGFLAWRKPSLRSRLMAIQFPLPEFSMPIILLVALLARIPLIYDSLWYDEAFTARVASVPLSQLGAAIMGDVHPPLWYTLEWVWTRIVGSSEIALRLPSLLFGLALIPLGNRLAKDLGLSDPARRLACLLLALFPATAYYSVEARGYALLACLAFVMVIAVAENRPRVFLVAGALIVLTHNLGYIYLGVLGIFGYLRWRESGWLDKEAAVRWLIVPAAVAGLWLPFLIQQSKAVADGFWLEAFTPGMGLRLITDETIGRKLPDMLVIPVYTVFLVLTIVGLIQMRRSAFRSWLWLALAFAVPWCVALLSLVWQPVYLTRALLPCGAALAFLWALVLTEHPARGVLRALAIPALLIAAACAYIPSLGREDVRALIAPCRGVAASYATSIPAAVFLSYYVDAPLLNWSEAGDLNQTLTPASKAALGLKSGGVSELSRDVCLVALDTPNTTAAEHAEVERVLKRYPHSSFQEIVSPLYKVNIYRLTLGEQAHG